MRADFYSRFPTPEFKKGIAESCKKLNQLGTGRPAGAAYDAVVKLLRYYLRDVDFEFESHKQTHLAIAALTHECGEVNILEQLINKQRFVPLFEKLIAFLDANKDRDAFVLLTKKWLQLYYQRYFCFEQGVANAQVREQVLNRLTSLLTQYTGRNRMTTVAKNTPNLIEGKLDAVLLSFDALKSLDEIRVELVLSDNFDIFQRLRLMKMLERIRTLRANQYDDQVERLFEDVKKFPHVWANSQRLMLEECVRAMLSQCKEADGKVGKEWEAFIFDTIGDPRSSRKMQAWQRVGTELHQWYRSILSRGDLREFLMSMTDGQGDEIYQYRKQFWLQYVDYAVNAKIMLGKNAFSQLKTQNPNLCCRFDSSPETYSRLEEGERSCVFIDFGNFCVIEGTHNAKLRIYTGFPIRLNCKTYRYTDFYETELAKSVLKKDQTHHHSEQYSWQNEVRVLLNQWIKQPTSLESVVLDEDNNPGKLLRIKDYLRRNGQKTN